MAGTYRIICRPEDRGTVVGPVEKNHSAIVIKLTNGSHTEEFCRVGHARENSLHPDKSLKAQLDDAMARAEVARDFLNDNLAGSGDLL